MKALDEDTSIPLVTVETLPNLANMLLSQPGLLKKKRGPRSELALKRESSLSLVRRLNYLGLKPNQNNFVKTETALLSRVLDCLATNKNLTLSESEVATAKRRFQYLETTIIAAMRNPARSDVASNERFIGGNARERRAWRWLLKRHSPTTQG